MKIARVLACCLVFAALSAVAQTSANATVYIYRARTRQFKWYPALVICDGLEVARMRGNSYLTLTLAPGEHILHSSDHKNMVTLNLAAGETRYIRLDINKWGWVLSAKLMEVPSPVGEKEASGLASVPSMVPAFSRLH